MEVQLKPGEQYDYYPYLDTMKFYNPSTGISTNAGKSVPKNAGYRILQDMFWWL